MKSINEDRHTRVSVTDDSENNTALFLILHVEADLKREWANRAAGEIKLSEA